MRVAGREAGACVVEVGLEVEGGIAYRRCHLSLPIELWPGIATESDPAIDGDTLIAGIEDRCDLVGTCCILPGCPDPCETELPDVPRCPLLPPLACE